MRGEHDLTLAVRRAERDREVGDRVEAGRKPAAPTELDEEVARGSLLRAERVARDAVYISGCHAHLIEQRGGGVAQAVNCGMNI